MNLGVWFASICLAVWVTLGGYIYTCHCRMLCDELKAVVKTGEASSSPSKTTARAMQVYYQDKLVMSAPAEVIFQNSQATPELPEASRFLPDSLRFYLLHNPNKVLVIKGLYLAKEQNSTSFENLGIARAEAFKGLINNDFNPQQIRIASAATSANGAETGLLQLSIEDLPAVTQENAAAITLKDPKQQFKAEELKILQSKQFVYFQTGSSLMLETAESRTYFQLLKQYLTAYPNSQIQLTGHTDNQGSEDINLPLGLQRAEDVKLRLGQQGLPTRQITTASQGSKQPIADNNTEAGRYQNRRVEINFLKQE
ncbi:MAG TPA: hypothetical protein DCM08_14460 [Microscillaceae bacterium]|nr:hypothetical protein [Microscillaceae bacterium]